ncbi:MAG: carboxypeptidase regulatory-like domain-containing protein [Acidobacteria bacterium]|nr:carboxypeptidase regulatory-like domain-containing protein [Acidobacteriota bacterium]
MSSSPSARPARLHRPLLGAGIALAAFAVLAVLAARPAAATPYDNGQPIQFKGVVSDPEGRPVQGVQVALEASRRYLSLRQLRRAEKDVRRVGAVTDAQGRYAIEWPWDAYFNHLEILAGVAVRHGKEEDFEVYEREDVTGRVLEGSPVVSAIVIHNRGFVDRLRAFVASVKTADQRRVYEEMGVPDDVKRVEVAGRPEEAEVSWWYFAAGKVYRFRAGRLDQVERFDPVQRF